MSMKSNKKKIILVVIIIIVLLFLIIIFVGKRQQMYFVKESFQEALLNENKEVIHQLIVQYNLWQKAARTADINYFN